VRVNIYFDLVPKLGARETAHLRINVKVTLEQAKKSQGGE
jgi:hypothetical protein